MPQDANSPRIPYIAVSYTWDPKPDSLQWQGRRITTQALALAQRLAVHTSYAIWIDAICIPQDDEEAKQAELPKMADIYRGAEMVICLVSGVTPETSEIVRRSVHVMETGTYSDLVAAGDIYGCYLFATGGGHGALRVVFGHRWWERAWTFQEAVLNPRTYVVGDMEDSIPIQDVLKIALVVRRRASSVAPLDRRSMPYDRPPSFWDSVSAMAVASRRALTLGEAIACVWRRDASVRHDLVYSMVGVCGLADSVTPSYKKPFDAVLRELFDAASALGDYSWVTWAVEVDPHRCQAGMGLVPTPEVVRATPFTSITTWRSIPVPPGLQQKAGADVGVTIPYRSTGIVQTQSPPMHIADAVAYLHGLGHTDAEVWDMLFGARVGFMADVGQAVGNDGIAAAAVNCALCIIQGIAARDLSDMSGWYPYTSGYSFTNYSVMAAEWWKRSGFTHLVVASSQGGTMAVPTDHDGLPRADRMYILPVSPSSIMSQGRMLVFFTTANSPFGARGTTVMVAKARSSSGGWQTRMIG